MKKKILIVAAHPDDEILGCGGTIAKLVNEGHKAYTLILGEGATARGPKRTTAKFKREIKELKLQAKCANKIIGVSNVSHYAFPDNRFDTVAFLDIVKTIEKIKNNINPDIVFTHYKDDLNIDHQITYRAVLTATRPLKKETVKEIYSFEVPSSTEWNYPLSFNPDVFFDVTKTMCLKSKAFKEYKNELREFPHPRSDEALKIIVRNWGIRTGLVYAEAFKVVRIII